MRTFKNFAEEMQASLVRTVKELLEQEQPLAEETATLKRRVHFTHHQGDEPVGMKTAITGRSSYPYNPGHEVHVIGHHAPSGTSLVHVPATKHYQWVDTKKDLNLSPQR